MNIYTPIKLEQIFRNRDIEEKYSYQIISAIITYITWHEIMHIAFGHCTILKENENKISNQMKRNFEMMCDLKAATYILAEIFCQVNLSHNEKLSMYASLYCSLSIYFKVLEDQALKDMEVKKLNCLDSSHPNQKYKSVTCKSRTHPFTTIRFDSICIAIECQLTRMKFTEMDIDRIYEKSIEFSDFFGFRERFVVNPFYRRNKKSQIKDMSIEFDEMKKYIQKIYVDI